MAHFGECSEPDLYRPGEHAMSRWETIKSVLHVSRRVSNPRPPVCHRQDRPPSKVESPRPSKAGSNREQKPMTFKFDPVDYADVPAHVVHREIGAQIEHMIDFLDGVDGDAEREPYLAGFDMWGDDREGDPAESGIADYLGLEEQMERDVV